MRKKNCFVFLIFSNLKKFIEKNQNKLGKCAAAIPLVEKGLPQVKVEHGIGVTQSAIFRAHTGTILGER